MKTIKMVIPALKGRTGHLPHCTGTGVHRDKRLKRCHTRQQQKRHLVTQE